MPCQINHLFSESICMCRDDSENITLKSGACICIILCDTNKTKKKTKS